MGGIMETQPTQQGLMQLFMSLGLSTADSLTSLGEGEIPEGTGFDRLLAGYLPDAAVGTLSLEVASNGLDETKQTSNDLALNSMAIAEELGVDGV